MCLYNSTAYVHVGTIVMHVHTYTAVFFYMIGNMEPKLQSSLRCIQLIACVTTPVLWL